MSAGKLARTPWEAWSRHADRRPTVVFAPHVKAAEDFAAEFRQHGVRVAVVSDRCSSEERKSVLFGLQCGHFDVVCNVAVLTEGWDCPRVSCVIVARRVGSQALWIQMTGRGLRPAQGKTDCLLLDLAGNAHTLGRPDEDRTYHLDGDGIRLATERPTPLERLCKVCGCPLGQGEDFTRVCPECGKDHSLEKPKSIGVELDEWRERYEAAKHALQPTRSALALASILRKADDAARAGKPWKPAAVRFRFRAVFHRDPFAEEMQQAIAVNKAAAKYPMETA